MLLSLRPVTSGRHGLAAALRADATGRQPVRDRGQNGGENRRSQVDGNFVKLISDVVEPPREFTQDTALSVANFKA